MTDFAVAFREHVVPRLRRECAVQAAFLAGNLTGWQDAENVVREIALQRGALSMPEAMAAELLDHWIPTQLLSEVDKAEAILAALGAAEAKNPTAYYDRLAATCRDPDRARAAFAAISPAYRNHLRGRRLSVAA